MTLSANARKRLTLLIPMLGSDKDGEVVASVRQIAKALAAEGKDFHDLVRMLSQEPTVVYQTVFRDRPEPKPNASRRKQWDFGGQADGDWIEKADFCEAHLGLLSEREAEFVQDMTRKLRRYGDPTERQASWLDAIYHRIRRQSHAAG